MKPKFPISIYISYDIYVLWLEFVLKNFAYSAGYKFRFLGVVVNITPCVGESLTNRLLCFIQYLQKSPTLLIYIYWMEPLNKLNLMVQVAYWEGLICAQILIKWDNKIMNMNLTFYRGHVQTSIVALHL